MRLSTLAKEAVDFPRLVHSESAVLTSRACCRNLRASNARWSNFSRMFDVASFGRSILADPANQCQQKYKNLITMMKSYPY